MLVPALATYSLRLAVDGAQFLVRGSEPEDNFDDVLLSRATQAPPSHSDTVSMLVLTPHQNNFDTAVDVEVWGQRPEDDRVQWQQVSEGPLTVDSNEVLHIDSPMSNPATCPVPAGRYIVEVSGRGFITYGWPGSTEPGDVWRLRLWPDDGTQLRAPKLWNKPDTPVTDPADMVSEPLRYGTISTAAGKSGLDTVATEPEFTPLQITTNPIIAAIHTFAGSNYLYAADPELVTAIVERDPESQRHIAVWAAGQACTNTKLMDTQWIRDALAGAAQNQPVDLEDHYERIREEPDPTQPQWRGLALFSYPTLHRALTKPFAYSDSHPRHHAAFAVAAIAATGQAPALRAAVEALHQACMASGDKDTELRGHLRKLIL